MGLSSKYNPSEIEGRWYEYWLKERMFHSEPDERTPYTIVIPPPNVTGVLHMGHMLNNTIQDVLVRHARLQGKNACWVPGTDHASIATEAKVVGKLAAEGISKHDLTREEFLEHAWEWTEKHGGIILEQLKKLGCSCDWERTAFTMDEVRSKSVYKVFCDLYEKGLIYRGVRMVNWDPKALTALSDEEVNYKEQNGKLYYLKYKISPPTPQRGDSDKPGYQTSRSASYALLKENAKEMRKFSTEAESALWQMLRGKNLGDKFRRQHIIDNFIVDFVCLSKKLIVEVDGAYHNDPETAEADALRTEILNSLGYNILRFTNEEVIVDTESVLNKIEAALSSPFGGVEGAYAIVATTRPETIMGDTAMCINPNNPKTAHLKGKKVIVPLIGREIPVIEDEYVDIEFGTGCLKVTPAHDINDYMLGEKHNLESIDIFNDNGTLNQNGEQYAGLDRFACRKQIVSDLEEAGLLEKVEPYTNKVGFSERTDVPIEPKLSMQWWLKMDDLAKPALDIVEDDTIKFYPEKFKNTYRHWMTNIKDWCISRQLWWGHQIPAYYLPKGGFVVAETKEQALEKAKAEVDYPLTIDDLRQDNDCLDTWFSSWLWPISVFDGINNPDNREINYYYPTQDLVTGPDIIFFWVARMIMAGCHYRGERCFENVYFTGIVRDKLGRKMSKQLGNSPDPIELMEKYGADGVRMGLLLTAPAGNDLPFDEALCETGRNFCNKIWNAFRLIQSWEIDESLSGDHNHNALVWFDNLLETSIEEIKDLFEKYRLSEAITKIYKLFWDDFCSWYLEIVKPEFGKPIDRHTYEATLQFISRLLRLLHPFMPFISEELWEKVGALVQEKSCRALDFGYIIGSKTIMFSKEIAKLFPERNSEIVDEFEATKEIVTHIRNIRASKNISPKEPLTFNTSSSHSTGLNAIIEKLGNVEITVSDETPEGASSFMVGTNEYSLLVGDLINVEEEIKKLEAELKYQEGFLLSVMKKLSNEKFVANAKPEIVENERNKQATAEAKIATIKENLQTLKSK